MNFLSWIAAFLSALGAINWGLSKFFKLNLVEYLNSMVKVNYLEEALYGVISVSGLFLLLSLFMG